MAVCSICGGSPEEHEGRQHAFTEREGDLRVPEKKPTGQTILRLPPIQGTDSGAIGRLVEVLLEKGMIDMPQALYVMGVGSKPERAFADPAHLGMSEAVNAG